MVAAHVDNGLSVIGSALLVELRRNHDTKTRGLALVHGNKKEIPVSAFRKGHVIVLCLEEAAGLAAAEKARLVISAAIGTQPTMRWMRFIMHFIALLGGAATWPLAEV